MKYFIIYIALLATIISSECNIILMPEVVYYNASPTAKVDNYVLQYQRQFEDQIHTLNTNLEDFRKIFKMRLEAIEFYNSVVNIKLRDMKDKLDPLEMLGDVSNVCVEKYRNKMPSDDTINTNLKTCINKANTAFSSLITNPDSTLKNIRNHFNSQFNNAIKDCKKKFERDEMKYKNCVTLAIKSTSTYFSTNSNTFNTQMAAARCSSNTKIDEAFDCYSHNIYQAFTTMGEVNGLIEHCLAGFDVCIGYEYDINFIKGRCPYHMTWNLNDKDLTDEKIVNPFKGINSTTPCLQINFITNTFLNTVNKE